MAQKKYEILKDRKIMKNIFYQKRGLGGRKYARDHKLAFTSLTRILNGNDLLLSSVYKEESPVKKVAKQLFKDKMWVGPVPDGMIVNPLVDFHRGAELGAFSKNGDLIISRSLLNHLKTNDITPEEVFVLAAIDAFSRIKGFCTESDATIGSIINKNEVDVQEIIKELWLNTWLKIETTKDERRIQVIKTCYPAVQGELL